MSNLYLDRQEQIKKFMAEHNLNKLNKSKEVAHAFRYSDEALRRSRVTGSLSGVDAPKYKKIGTAVFYAIDDLYDWFEHQCEETAEGM